MSTVLAVALLVGLTLVGIIVIISVGWVNINDANQQANTQIAEEAMLQIDSTFQQSSGSNASVTIPSEMEGHVSVSNEPSYALRLNENQNCSTGTQNLSTVQYVDGGRTVAYQGGGVWQMSGGGASMTSPPDVSYDDGSLSVSFIEIDGQVGAGDTLRSTAGARERTARQQQMDLALYTNQSYSTVSSESLSSLRFRQSCDPSEVQNATLRIENSQYARAWADWARDNHDSRLVSTTPSGEVEPGDTVTIHYMLGDVSPPYFEVSNVGYTRASSDDPVEVTATVTNTGGLETTRSVNVIHNGKQVNETKLTLGEDERTRIKLGISGDDLESGDGTINVSANDTVSRPVVIESPAADAVPETELEVNEPISNVSVAEPAEGTVDITNPGSMTAVETLKLTAGGETIRTWNRTVDPGETVTVDVGTALPTDEEVSGETFTISGDIAADSETIDGTYTVAPPATFSIQSVDAPSDAENGDDIDVSAEIVNTGSRSATMDVAITIEDPSGSEVVNYESTEGLSAGSTTTVTADHTLSDTGEYRYTIETPNETTTGSFYTGDIDGPNFRIVSSSGPDRARVGTTAQFGLVVENTGDTDATRTLEVVNESGDLVESQQVSVNAGSTTYPTVDVPLTNPQFTADSEYTLRFNISDAETSKTIDVHDDSVINCEDGTCTNTVEVDAEITLEGAEFERTTRVGRRTLASETYSGSITDESPEGPDGGLAQPYTIEVDEEDPGDIFATTGEHDEDSDISYQNMNITLTDEDGNVLADSQSNPTVSPPYIRQDVEGGTYTVWVASEDGDATGSYDLTVNYNRLTFTSVDLVDISDDPVDGETTLPGTEAAPTTVRLLTDGTEEGDGPLWDDEPGDGNINAPAAEAELAADEGSYTTDVELPPGTDVSFGASAYSYCQEYDYDNPVIHTTHRPTLGYEFPGVADVPCEDYDGDGGWDVDSDVLYATDNPDTEIYTDGDDAIERGNPVHLPLRRMVDGQIDEDGQFDLATDERIYALELSQYAYVRSENRDELSFPEADYNDAVIRYNVVGIDKDTSAPARFEINSVDRPVQVGEDETVSFDATVENVGDEEGTTNLAATFEDNGTASVETADDDSEVTLNGGETEDITITLDSTGISPIESNYDWAVDAEANPSPTPEASGSVYVGNGDADSAELTIASVDGPVAIEEDDSATATVEVANIGNSQFSGSKTVTLQVDNETDGTSYTETQTFDETLGTDGRETVTFDLPESKGEYSYDVAVSGKTSRERSFFVGTSSVDLRDESSINIGTHYYNTSSLIERDGDISAMNVRLENTGTIGDDREVELTISDNDGNTVFSETQTTNFGQGDIRTQGTVRNTSTFDTDLEPGYYDYEITVLEDGNVDSSATGSMYLRNTSDGVSTTEDSPVDVDSSEVTVSD